MVRIPLLPNPSPIAASAAAKPASGSRIGESNGKQVLVVDDNRDAANTMALLLRKWGHEVNMAYDGHEAVTAAETHKPDLILLDIGLPGRDGYEVARLIRAARTCRHNDRSTHRLRYGKGPRTSTCGRIR